MSINRSKTIFSATAATLFGAAGLGAAFGSAPPPPKKKAVAAPTAADTTFQREINPLVQKYCVACHSKAGASAGVVLEGFKDSAGVLNGRKVWSKASANIDAGNMPPAGSPQPTAAERDKMVNWIDGTISQADCQLQDPGRVTMRRLNKVEYNNTVRDLTGLDDLRPADKFPSDDIGYGFDNNGDVLSISPLLMEKYLAAAETVSSRVMESPAARQRLGYVAPVSNQPKDELVAAQKTLGRFARRAWRRPLTASELAGLTQWVAIARKNGDDFDTGIALGIQATLVSPNFLFRVETSDGALNGYELATRLSYFLWRSTPDEALMKAAADGSLVKPAVLAAQTKRMLSDPKSKDFATDFADQWLTLRNLETAAPDSRLFDGLSRGDIKQLLKDMRLESQKFVSSLVGNNGSVLDLLDGRYTYLNQRLANYYGYTAAFTPDGTDPDGFKKISLSDGHRGGVLTQASVLTVTSNPSRTSPVKRGKWVLEQILGTPPPPPPPGVGELKQSRLVGTLRERMEQHRKDPACASCHARMDPIGFGLENFNAVGAWREKDNNESIDASGVLPDGKKFDGPSELRQILLSKKGQFVRSFTEKMLTYAIGRGIEPTDRCNIDAMAAAVAKNDYKMSALIVSVVESEPFRKRRGEAPEKPRTPVQKASR